MTYLRMWELEGEECERVEAPLIADAGWRGDDPAGRSGRGVNNRGNRGRKLRPSLWKNVSMGGVRWWAKKSNERL